MMREHVTIALLIGAALGTLFGVIMARLAQAAKDRRRARPKGIDVDRLTPEARKRVLGY
jgi:hypothetical protein